MIQTTKQETWIDESGREITLKYITPSMRMRERHSASMLKDAKSINAKLKAFKAKVNKLTEEVYILALEELNAKGKDAGKGNFTFFNFDRSIKIEVSVSDRITFDDLTIQACKIKFDEFIGNSIDAKTEVIKKLVTDAFSTSKGKLDTKRILSLLKYKTTIGDPLFQEALDLIAQAIRRPDSKTYFRVWERMADNSYKLIDLNFSSI